jgi:ribose transport system permease protein
MSPGSYQRSSDAVDSAGSHSRAGVWTQASRFALRRDLPAVVFAIALLAVMADIEPSVLSSTGLDLTFLGIVPFVFAALAQMIMLTGGDIDLSLGSALGLVNAICATELQTHPVIGVLELLAFVVGYMAMGALIELRRLPSLVVTFAFGFIWLGFALVVLPTPGGTVPTWMTQLFTYTIPGIPEPLLLIAVLAVLAWVFMMKSRPGRQIRALGSRRLSARQYARRPLNVRLTMYGCAGVVIVLGGFALTAQAGSGDPNSGQSFVLVSVAAVVLGGGEFSGGTVWPIGAVFGAIALGLVAAIDSYLQISSNLVIGFEGLLLIVALAIRRGLSGLELRVATAGRASPEPAVGARRDPAERGIPAASEPGAQSLPAPRGGGVSR